VKAVADDDTLFQKGMPIRREAGALSTWTSRRRARNKPCEAHCLESGTRDQAAVKGALNNGLIVEDINAVLLYATAYCRISAGLDAFRTTHERWSSRAR
jgi:hypothetical protein